MSKSFEEISSPQKKIAEDKEVNDTEIIDDGKKDDVEISGQEINIENELEENPNMIEMLKAQEEVEKEIAEFKSEGVLLKIPEKIKKPLMIALAGATLFFSMGSFEKAEARWGYNYSDMLKDAMNDIIRNYPRQIEQQRRQRENEQQRQRQAQERQIQRDQEQIRREFEQKRREFDRQRQRALQEYQRDIDRAKKQDEIDIARRKYKLKIKAIDEAENASYDQ